MVSRIEQRDTLLTSLGMLVEPVKRLVFSDDDPRALVPYVRAQFEKDFETFYKEADQFCRTATHRFGTELTAIAREAQQFVYFLDMIRYPEQRVEARNKFPQQIKETHRAIRAVPCDEPGTILPAESPYSTYIRLGATVRGATARLELFDPYLQPETFHRYLPDIPDGINLMIVTGGDVMDLSPTASPTKKLRRDRIVSVSELLAIQFPDRYQFRVISEQHDRHVRIDDTILHLGGSSHDAGKSDYFTISNLDPIQSNHAFLDGIITRATEWYGPTVKPHRRA